jgi:hypothetical protein
VAESAAEEAAIEATDLEVAAAEEPDPGLLDGFVAAVIGFLFG